MRLELKTASQQPRSIIANAARCVNLYPERNPPDALVPFTFYQRPGMKKVAQGPVAPVRGLFRASNGTGYAVIGQGVYLLVQPNQPGELPLQLVPLGVLTYESTNPVSFVDNGTTGLLVDGGADGFTMDLENNYFTLLSDPTGSFQGADRVDYIDTFTLMNNPGTNQFISTLSNELVFDNLYIAAKTNWPDKLQTLIVSKHYILLVGTLTTEIWYDAGNAGFPFAEFPGTFIEHGALAKYSIAKQDIAVYFLSQDLQGQGIVLKIANFQATRISNHALEYQIQQMAASGIISDAIGYCYQQGGHVFYVLTFPTGNQTWVFDEATQEWSQRGILLTGENDLQRDRSNCHGNIYGMNLVGDFANGAIYELLPGYYLDDYPSAGSPTIISCFKGFPHFNVGMVPGQGPGPADGKLLEVTRFTADFEAGNGPLDPNGNPSQIMLRWSTDRGKTFKNWVGQNAGAPGDYQQQPQWGPIGTARDIVFELGWTVNGAAALNGGWIDVEVMDQ